MSRRISFILFACAAISYFLAEAQQNPSPEPRVGWEAFDGVLETILKASNQRFRPVEGPRIENRRREFYFEARVYLPEAMYCRIFDQGGLVYCCEWEVKSQASSTSVYEKLVTRIESALGTKWAKRARSGRLRKEMLFSAEGKPIVQAIQDVNPPQVYVLVLPAGSSKDGYVGSIPSMGSFLHP